jgi:hypothetical protein
MAIPPADVGFAVYELTQVDTGIPLYTTYATPAEIHQANANLRNRGIAARFFPAGTFSAPSLHDRP